jgi:hypothetical protein
MAKIIFYSNGSDELCYDLEYWENELDEFLSLVKIELLCYGHPQKMKTI